MNTRIPPSIPGAIARPQDTRRRNERTGEDLSSYRSPRRQEMNYIPSPDHLRSMVERALEALSKGVYWERGSIINLVL